MNKTAICLIGLFLTANSFAQNNTQNINKNNPAPVKSTKKSFSVAPFKIPVGKGDKQEMISANDFKKKAQVVDKVPDFVKQQANKPVSPAQPGKAKVFPPNVTNFTAQDIKNDPTLQKGKVFYIKEDPKPALSVMDEYNQRRERFLKKKEAAKNINLQRREQLLQAQREALQRAREKDQYRKQMGLPISRFENNAGPDGRQAGVTREAMSAMSNGASLPKVPPTGNVQ